MRKALMGVLLAATVAAPVASAAAQNHGWGGRSDRQQARSERQEQRSERRSDQFQNRGQGQSRQNFQRAERPSSGPISYTSPVDRGERNASREQFRRSNVTRQSIADRREDRPRTYQVQSREWQGNDGRDRNGNWRDNRNDRNWNGNQNRNWNRGDRDWNRNDRNGYRSWNRGGRSHNWNQNWRSDRRYDWQRYRYSNRSHFHMPRYYSPYRGYGYSRFSIGFFLEPLFYSSNYWISDPWSYRLPPAYPGTRWVRYYNDVLLVDMYTGEVVDVIYDFFW
jgi:hypothetical protein